MWQGKQMTGGNHKSYWCALRSTTTNPHIRSRSAQLESRVPRNWPARFGAGERPLVLYLNVRTRLSGETARVRSFRSVFFTRMFERKVDVSIAFAIGERSMPC